MSTAVLSHSRNRGDAHSTRSLSLSLMDPKELLTDATETRSPPPVYTLDAQPNLKQTYRNLKDALLENPDNELNDLIARDLDVAYQFFAERLKVNLSSCKEITSYIKRLYGLIEELSNGFNKLSDSLMLHTSNETLKPGQFLCVWKSILEKTNNIGKDNLERAKVMQSCVSALQDLHKHTERSRKLSKDTICKLKKAIDEAEVSQEKTKVKLDQVKEEISRLNSVIANGSPYKTSLFKSSRSPAKVLDELITRQSALLVQYQDQSLKLHELKDAFTDSHLPTMVKTMRKLDADLSNILYQQLQICIETLFDIFRNSSMKIKASDADAMLNLLKNIDDSRDTLTHYKIYYDASLVESMAIQNPKNKSRKASDQQSATASPVHSPTPDPIPTELLTKIVSQRKISVCSDIPDIVSLCVGRLEKPDIIKTAGLYRVSSTNKSLGCRNILEKLQSESDSQVKRELLKQLGQYFDQLDPHAIANLLKSYIRDLDPPLFPKDLSKEFVSLFKSFKENKVKSNQIVLRVKNLLATYVNDKNMKLLEYVLKHLKCVQEFHTYNKMTAENLGIVFGPTLFSSYVLSTTTDSGEPCTSEATNSCLLDIKVACEFVAFLILNADSLFDVPL